VERALDTPAVGVAGEHETPARRAQLLDLAPQALDGLKQFVDVVSLNDDTRGR
jgi:hypothetical protein